MKEYEEIPNNNSMKVLYDVVNFECSNTCNVVLCNITENYC